MSLQFCTGTRGVSLAAAAGETPACQFVAAKVIIIPELTKRQGPKSYLMGRERLTLGYRRS